MQARVLEAHLDCAQHWERIPSRAQVLEEALWMENGILGTAIQC